MLHMGIEQATVEAGSVLMASVLSRELKMKKCASILMAKWFFLCFRLLLEDLPYDEDLV
jgi:hypothetical protein